MRKQKSNELNKIITDKEDNEQLDTADMPNLESEESAKQWIKRKAQGLKILTPEQMFSRLPIYLAKLKAGNSQKRKNEIKNKTTIIFTV